MTEPYLIIVILNTNRRDDTLECLESLSQSTYRNSDILVLDNHSTDGSVEAIQKRFPHVQIAHIEENRGYAGNNNVGIDLALKQGAEWVFVLNEDTVLDPDCLTRLVEAGSRDPRTGIVGPMVYHHDEPGIIQSAGGILDRYWRSIHMGQNELDHGQFAQTRAVDWISGCAILVRGETIRQVGALDEQFFYYWEETEWCLRAREHGWQVLHVPQAKIWHKGVQRNYKPGPNVTYYATRNHLLMMAKHRAPLGVWLNSIANDGRTLLSWTIRPKWRMMKMHRLALWQAIVDFSQGRYGKRLE